jgi:hypothetical protein
MNYTLLLALFALVSLSINILLVSRIKTAMRIISILAVREHNTRKSSVAREEQYQYLCKAYSDLQEEYEKVAKKRKAKAPSDVTCQTHFDDYLDQLKAVQSYVESSGNISFLVPKEDENEELN